MNNSIIIPFHSKDYWDEYYKHNAVNFVDWYFEVPLVKSKLLNLDTLSKDSEILMIGIGNSNLIDTLIEKKFKHVTSIDFSNVIITYLSEKYEKIPECREYDFLTLDVCNLTSELPSNSIDIVMDKGCLDCLMTHPKGEDMFIMAIKEINSILKEDGLFYMISSAKPDKRIHLMTKEILWTMETEEISKKYIKKGLSDFKEKDLDYCKDFHEEDNIYYIYLLKKKKS